VVALPWCPSEFSSQAHKCEWRQFPDTWRHVKALLCSLEKTVCGFTSPLSFFVTKSCHVAVHLSPFLFLLLLFTKPAPGKMSENFDIAEPLTTRLRGLLEEYPPGICILKELLQNADDAKASTIVNSCLTCITSSPIPSTRRHTAQNIWWKNHLESIRDRR
jgi:hypothetical protein